MAENGERSIRSLEGCRRGRGGGAKQRRVGRGDEKGT